MSPLSTEVTVNVKVIDKSMPVFDKQFYSVSVPENIEIHSHLSVSIKAESSLTRKLIYSISNGNIMEQFAIDFNTGKKRLLPSYSVRTPFLVLLRSTSSPWRLSIDTGSWFQF